MPVWKDGNETTVELLTEADRELAYKLLAESTTGAIFKVRPPRRSDLQNRRLHGSIRDVAQQVRWADGNLSEDDWKRLFTAAIFGQRVVPGLLGGFVVLDRKTSRMKVADVAEVQEFIYAFGADRGVVWEHDDD